VTTAWKDDGYNVVLLHKQTISKDCIVCFNFNCFQFCFYIYREIISKQPSTLCFFTLFNSWDTIQLSYNVNVYRLFLHCFCIVYEQLKNITKTTNVNQFVVFYEQQKSTSQWVFLMNMKNKVCKKTGVQEKTLRRMVSVSKCFLAHLFLKQTSTLFCPRPCHRWLTARTL